MRAAELPKSRRRRVLPADAATAAAILLLGLILAGTGGRVVQRWRSSSARNESLGFEDQLGIVANTAGLIVTVSVGHVPCHCGRGGAPRNGPGRSAPLRLQGKFAPAFMRRLALAAVGLQLLTAPLAPRHPPWSVASRGARAWPPRPRHPLQDADGGPQPARCSARRFSWPPIRNGGHSARSSNPAR